MTTIRNRRDEFIFSLSELVGSADAMVFRLVSKEVLESLKRLEQLFGGTDLIFAACCSSSTVGGWFDLVGA